MKQYIMLSQVFKYTFKILELSILYALDSRGHVNEG